jgi:hypothetical protein
MSKADKEKILEDIHTRKEQDDDRGMERTMNGQSKWLRRHPKSREV